MRVYQLPEPRTVYLAGPIKDCTDTEANAWRHQVEEVLDRQYRFLNPMRRGDYRGVELSEAGVHKLVRGDIDDIWAADIVLANCWKATWGTAMEIKEAFDARKLAIVICPDEYPSPWLLYHSTEMVPSLGHAIDLLTRLAAR